MYRILFFAGLFLCCPAIHAVEYPGTWSNGKSEFDTVSLMVRSDGQGVFSVSVISAFALWKKTDEGLVLTIGESGKSFTLHLTYDSSNGTLTGTLRGTHLVLRKVSDQQPPDILARAKAKQAEDQALWEKRARFEVRALPSRHGIRTLVCEWLAAKDPNSRPETIFISVSESKHQLTLRDLGGPTYTIEVSLEARFTATPTGYPLESKNLPGDATSDLPPIYELTALQRERLKELGSRPGVKAETHAFSQVSAFATESFYRSMHFRVPKAGESDALVEDVVRILWPDKTNGYTAKLLFRVSAAAR